MQSNKFNLSRTSLILFLPTFSIIAGNIIIISIVIVMMVCCGDRRESAGMTSGGHNLMGWW